MAAKQNRPSQKRSTVSRADSANPRPFPMLALLAWVPLLTRWFIPTEGTDLGETLWLTVVTFLVAAVVAWQRWRNEDVVGFDRFDLAVCVFAGTHVISAIVVVVTEGQKRAATNMLWEWLAVAVQFALIRWTLAGSLRLTFVRVFVAVWVAQAGFGIWQHFAWYPASIERYEQLRLQLDELESGGSGLSGSDRALRLRELRNAFLQQGIPMSGPGRSQFEGRLKDSADPVGFFALTNTFAGFLAVLIVLLYGSVLAYRRSPPALAAAAAALAIAAYCLLLTKSRTGMCGAVGGLVVATLVQQLQSRSGARLRQFVTTIIAIPVTVSLILGLAVASGGIDSDVLGDATKSLQYRFEYWTATSRVIADHPGLGTGPGNFRDAYLVHKLPQSSEEIADPHNFVLDVAANAGIPGTIGLAFLLWLTTAAVLRMIRVNHAASTMESSIPHSEDRVSAVFAPATILLAGLTVAGWTWLIENQFDLKVLCVSGIAAVIAWTLETRSATSPTRPFPAAEIAGGLTALLVHLLAAGGIAMPAVTGAVLVFMALLAAGSRQLAAPVSPVSRHTSRTSQIQIACIVAATIALVGCVQSAFLPVLTCATSLQQGDYSVVARGDARLARRAYDTASKQDSLSPEPFRRASALALQQWQASGDRRHLDEAITIAKTALQRSPHSASILQEIAYRYLQLARASKTAGSEAHADAGPLAVAWYERALARYPTHSLWTAEYADALATTGDMQQAATVARRALEQDDLNRELAHYDRFLPDAVRLSVERLAQPK